MCAAFLSMQVGPSITPHPHIDTPTNCVQCLFAYMAFSCTMLLGLMGGLLWQAALIQWELPCDLLTYVVVLYNFAVVGIVAIFYQKVRKGGSVSPTDRQTELY